MISFIIGAVALFMFANIIMGPFWKWEKHNYESLIFGGIIGLIVYSLLNPQ